MRLTTPAAVMRMTVDLPLPRGSIIVSDAGCQAYPILGPIIEIVSILCIPQR